MHMGPEAREAAPTLKKLLNGDFFPHYHKVRLALIRVDANAGVSAIAEILRTHSNPQCRREAACILSTIGIKLTHSARRPLGHTKLVLLICLPQLDAAKGASPH